MTILTDSFVPLHALLFWLIIEVVYPCLIPNNELWYKFLLGHVHIIREVLQKLVLSSGVSISTPIWQALCSYAEMHKIFIAQKSYCACRVLSIATIRSKYYFNFILIRSTGRPGQELFDRPSYLVFLPLFWNVKIYNIVVLCWCQSCVRLLLGVITVDDLSDELRALSLVKGQYSHCRISSQTFISLPLIGHGTVMHIHFYSLKTPHRGEWLKTKLQ